VIDPVLYPAGIDHVIETDAVVANALKTILLGPGYTYNSAHDTLSDLGANVVLTSDTITGVTVTAGIVTADDPEYSAYLSAVGDDVAGYVVWDSTDDVLIGYNGRLADGRPISFEVTAGGITHQLYGGRLLRLGGTG